MNHAATLTTGPIGARLTRMTGSMLLGIMGIMAFNLADTFFLGRYSTEALSAITFTFPVVMTLASLALGLGVGVSAVISNAIGEGDQHRVQRLTTDSLVLSVLIVVACAGAGLLTIDPLFRALGAEGEIHAMVGRYMRIWYWSVGFVVIPMVGNSAVRATGDTRTPSLVMLSAAVTNVILDPILIFGWGPIPSMGMEGAAIATAVSRASSLSAAVYVLGFREKMISRKGMTPSAVLASWRRILHVGLPSAATRMIVPFGVGLITRLIASFGPTAVAAFGVGSRVGMLVFAVVMALSAALAPFIGQNLGAGRPDRVHRAAWLATAFGAAYGVATWVVVALLARPIAGVFNDHPEVIEAAVRYFRIVPLGAAMSAALAVAGTVLNAMLKPGRAAALAGFQMFILNVPLSYLGARLLGLDGVWWAAVLANTVAGMAALAMMRSELEKIHKSGMVQ
ncbi:MAG: MATE family efflux transporter [bacterium]